MRELPLFRTFLCPTHRRMRELPLFRTFLCPTHRRMRELPFSNWARGISASQLRRSVGLSKCLYLRSKRTETGEWCYCKYVRTHESVK
ncbi:hypothetical protein FKM82_019694 [Ascaphus truei]